MIDGVAWKKAQVQNNNLEKKVSVSLLRDRFLQIVVLHSGPFPSDAISSF
jgi:hypothetical protein